MRILINGIAADVYKRHISDVKKGDTVIHMGELRTVDRNSMKLSSFMGLTLFGDSYQCGKKKVSVTRIVNGALKSN